MENRKNDLWQGGPWEQPSRPVLTPPYIPQPQRPALRVRRRRWLIPVVVLLLLAVLGAAAAAVLPRLREMIRDLPDEGMIWEFPYEKYDLPDRNRGEQPDYTTPPTIEQAAVGTGVTIHLEERGGEELSYTRIYDLCAPSLVSLTSVGKDGVSTGTGVVLTGDGYVLTNAHVVAGAYMVEVVTFDNRSAQARLVGFDPNEDLAVLKVELTGLTPARFGNSDDLVIGEQVAAIGDALGYRSTITDGIVSALDRDVAVDGITMTLIQTNAAINFGNSGGALINRQGQVVGITTVKLVAEDGSTESMGFAIPSTRVKYVADRLIAGEKIVPGVLGITVNTRSVSTGGLEVLSVEENSDAHARGVQAGDILLRANGQELTGVQVLTRIKTARGAGDIIVLTIQRGEEVFDLEVALTPVEDLEGYR